MDLNNSGNACSAINLGRWCYAFSTGIDRALLLQEASFLRRAIPFQYPLGPA